MIPYGRQSIDQSDAEAVATATRAPMITQGPTIERFEEAVASYVGASHAVAFSSGTAALHGAAAAAGLSTGDEVVVPPITFAASVNCVLYVGAKPQLVDVSSDTLNLDLPAAADRIDELGAKAAVPVSFAGLPVALERLAGVGEGVTIIEDAAHALGAERAGRKVGADGGADMTAFSFHPVKPMTTGEGGMVVTASEELAERLRAFRTHGIVRDPEVAEREGPWFYDLKEIGFNYRITDIQCALGLNQLPRLDSWIERRNEIAETYRKALADVEDVILPPAAGDGDLHGYHLFAVQIRGGPERRRTVFEILRASGIGVQVHYIPLYRLSLYREMGFDPVDYPNSERYYQGAISLPIFPALGPQETTRVVETLRGALAETGDSIPSDT